MKQLQQRLGALTLDKLDSGYGITDAGFNIRDFNSIADYVKSRLQSEDKFGANIDFTNNDPLYQLSVPFMELIAEMWEVAEQDFYAGSPKYAEGIPLTNTGKYIGIGRKQPFSAIGIERFYGTAGTKITKDIQIGTDGGVTFLPTQEGTITGTYIDLPIQCTTSGAIGNTPANTITKVITPVIGLTSITNPTETSKGEDEETDTNFRTRYQESTELASGSTLDAVKAILLTLTGVQDVSIEENDNDTIENGIPAHSFETFVYGGADNDVAQAIFDKRPGGIKAFGTTIVDVTDTQGRVFHIGFSRPTSVPIWFKITKTVDSTYPTDGDTQIKTALLNYMKNIKLGEDIIVYKIISLISNLNLSGLLDIKVELSIDNITYVNTNQPINAEQVAITDINKVQVV
mgnify:FL=1